MTDKRAFGHGLPWLMASVEPGRGYADDYPGQLNRSNPSVDSPTYRRLNDQISEQEYKKALEEEKRRIDQPHGQAASGQ